MYCEAQGNSVKMKLCDATTAHGRCLDETEFDSLETLNTVKKEVNDVFLLIP